MKKTECANKTVIHKSTESILDSFLSLPRKAQLLFFEDLEQHCASGFENGYAIYYQTGLCYDSCKSPIEKIFNLAFDKRMWDLKKLDIEYELNPQYEIIANNHKYFADFFVSFVDDEQMEQSLKIIIECDGHEFHQKTKAQVKRDNERDYDLKIAGYDVIHFSGSQVYNDPIKCADDTILYIDTKIKEYRKNVRDKMD